LLRGSCAQGLPASTPAPRPPRRRRTLDVNPGGICAIRSDDRVAFFYVGSGCGVGGIDFDRKRLLERGAGRAPRADGILLTRLVQCLAQTPDMHIDRAGFNIDVRSPDRVEQLLA